MLAFLVFVSSAIAAPDWQSTITTEPPGSFPPLRPLRANYRFGWSGFTAASGDLHFTGPSGNRFQVDGTARTIGFVRALWKMDATYHASANASTLGPIEMKQTETYRRKKMTTQLSFTSSGVTRSRTEGADPPTTKTKQFSFPNLLDLHSTVLYLRSQPLKQGSVYRVVVYAATTPYLATLTVGGREKISVHAGTYDAIKIDLKLQKIGKNLGLEPHRKFRRATIWVSNDADRLMVRVEAQIFVGTVFAELQAVEFDRPKT